MRKYQNDCVGCENCCGCGLDNVLYLICDECEAEVNVLYEVDGKELCDVCALEHLPQINGEEE